MLLKYWVGAPPRDWRPFLGEVLDPPLWTLKALLIYPFLLSPPPCRTVPQEIVIVVKMTFSKLRMIY